MASVTVREAGTADTTALSVYPSGSFTPTVGGLLVLLPTVNGSLVSAGAAGTASASANGITFTRVDLCLTQGSGGQMYAFIADQLVPASPTSMTCSVDVTGDIGTGGNMVVLEVAGMYYTGAAALRQVAHLEAQTSGTTLAVTLAGVCLTGNVVIAAMCNATNPAGVTAPSSFTAVTVGGTGYINPSSGQQQSYRNSGHTSATVTWGTNSASAWSAMVLELDTTFPGTPLAGTPQGGRFSFRAGSPVGTLSSTGAPYDGTITYDGASGYDTPGAAAPVPRDSTLTVSTVASTSLVCTMPTFVAGDLLLAFYLQRGSTVAADLPTGWTTLASHTSGTNGAADSWGKVAVGGETLTVTKPGTQTASVTIYAITAGTYDATQWTEGYATLMALGGTLTPALPDSTSTVDRGLAISVAGVRSPTTTGSGLTAPGTWTQDESGFADNNTDGMSIGACSKIITPAGSTGAYTWTSPQNNSGPEVTVVVRPATGGPAPGGTALVYYWDSTAASGAGDYILSPGRRDWRTASADYLPTATFDLVKYWDAPAGQYRPTGSVVDTDPPSQPGTITTTNVTTTTITFNWVASTDTVGVTGYQIRLNGGAWVQTVNPTYPATGLTASTAYTPQIQARDAAGNWSTTATGAATSTSGVADVTAPTQPGQPTATPTGASVALSWTASTDAVGVTAYDVHRSATSGFTPGAGTLRLSVPSNSTTETNVPTGTWYYKIIARDAAGNSSTASTQRSVVVTSPVSPMLIGFNDEHTANDGGNAAPGWRTYSRGAMVARANQTGINAPLFHAYSPSAQITGSYAQVKADTTEFLEDFYFGNANMTVGSGAGSSTPSVRSSQLMYLSSGNENYEAGKALGMTVAAYTNVMRGQYDAVMTESSPGVRKFPRAYSCSNPTQNQEKSGTVAAYLHPTAQYHHCVIWSMYPPGRGATDTDPTFNWPTITKAETMGTNNAVNWNNLQAGHLGRCYRRTDMARDQARIDTGDPTFDIAIACGESGIGSDPGDSTTRPFYIVYGMCGAMVILADEFNMVMAFFTYWSNTKAAGGPHNILSDEPPNSDHGGANGTPTNPSSQTALLNWPSYDTRQGGTMPGAWTANPKPAWKTTGTSPV